MTNSQSATSCKCFSGIVGRLLCTSSLPTHPSDHFDESNTTNFNHQTEKKPLVQAPATPGIVARLMGLDSFPDINSVPTTTLQTMLRSRSVSYIDYLPQFDLKQIQHRRVQTSLSFREFPMFIEERNHDFLLLCPQKYDEINKKGSDVKKKKAGSQNLRQKQVEIRSLNNEKKKDTVLYVKKDNQEKNKKVCKREENPKRVFIKSSSTVKNVVPHKKNVQRKPCSGTGETRRQMKPVKPTDFFVGSKFTKKKKNQYGAKKVRPGCISENSSPVSVHNFHVFPVHLEAPISEEDSGQILSLNSRRDYVSKITRYDYPCPNLVRTTLTEDQAERTISRKAGKTMKNQETDYYYITMFRQICRLTEDDLKESNWAAGEVSKFEGCEEICLRFGQQILELLLTQVVDELVSLHSRKKIAM